MDPMAVKDILPRRRFRLGDFKFRVTYIYLAPRSRRQSVAACPCMPSKSAWWFLELPSDSIGTLLSNEGIIKVVSLRLALPLVQPCSWVYSTHIDASSIHRFSYRKLAASGPANKENNLRNAAVIRRRFRFSDSMNAEFRIRCVVLQTTS